MRRGLLIVALLLAVAPSATAARGRIVEDGYRSAALGGVLRFAWDDREYAIPFRVK